MRQKPLLLVDIDGVISLFGFAGAGHDHDHGGPHWAGHHGPADCAYATIDGIPHFLSRVAAAHLLGLAAEFELVWASGWEEKAEEYLPRLLGLPAGLPFLRSSADRARAARSRPLEARRDRVLRRHAGAGVDRRRVQRRLPCLGRRAPATDAARADRARTRAHRGRGAAADWLGAEPEALASRRRRFARTCGHSSSMTL